MAWNLIPYQSYYTASFALCNNNLQNAACIDCEIIACMLELELTVGKKRRIRITYIHSLLVGYSLYAKMIKLKKHLLKTTDY